MDTKKDQFWKHVEKLDCCLNVFKLDFCLKYKFCEHKFDGGVSRIKSHLAKVIDLVICKKLLELFKKKLIFLSKKKKEKKIRSLSSL